MRSLGRAAGFSLAPTLYSEQPTTSVQSYWHIEQVVNDVHILAVRGTVVKSRLRH